MYTLDRALSEQVFARALVDGKNAFSGSYAEARSRIVGAASELDAEIKQYHIGDRGPRGEELSMDAVRIGPADARRVVVVSSGVHGVEGFLGSAVQFTLLKQLLMRQVGDDDPALVILHAVNPYGFAWLRRVNENNVDLNRNFPTAQQHYRGCPEAYRHVDDLINPKTVSRWDLFYPRVAEKVIKYGFESLKQAVVNGQYECPRGLFYGGSSPTLSVDILERALPALIGPAEQVLHLDFHTGLGQWGEFKLLLDSENAASEGVGWTRFTQGFSSSVIEPVNRNGQDTQVVGSLGEWCRQRFSDRCYDVVCAEFGTYPALKVLAALREENRAHHWDQASVGNTWRAKRSLAEVFAPKHPGWRDKAVRDGMRIVNSAIEALRAPMLH